MPCLLVLLAFFAPRVALAALLVFSHFLERAYETIVWPLLGFFFMPVTTLTYAVALNWGGGMRGFWFFVVLCGALTDLGVLGGGVRTRANLRDV